VNLVYRVKYQIQPDASLLFTPRSCEQGYIEIAERHVGGHLGRLGRRIWPAGPDANGFAFWMDRRAISPAFHIMKHTIIKNFVLAALVALAPFLSALGLDEESVKIFSGEPRLLIVHGYSTSQHWWAFLQRKIDRHMGGPGRSSVEVRLCNKGGTPIARWMNLQDGTRSAAWERMLTPARGGATKSPSKGKAGVSSRILQRYDRDKDGKLNGEERAAFEKARRERGRK
jgi:hypothetical protein